jgi:hypothetical protein
MADLSLNHSRRKRLTDTGTGTSFKEGGASVVPIAIAVILAVALAALFLAPNQVDSALHRTATIVSDKKAVTTQVWNSVMSTLQSEDAAEREQIASVSPLSTASMLKPNESIATGNTTRTVLTRGHDILELEPDTTIVAGDRGVNDSTTIIQLLDGIIHVKAAKRTDGGTLSIETRYLVATVKGTKFDVVTMPTGAAVSVTEGIVWVRPVGSSDGVDVTRGRTAVVLAGDGATPTVSLTPDGGALAAIDVATGVTAGTGPAASANHHHR